MKQLHPTLEVTENCPHCEVSMTADNWIAPGMRTLAEFTCPSCGLEYLADLPTGHGLHYPMLVDRESGVVRRRGEAEIVHPSNDSPWFAAWLQEDIESDTPESVDVSVEGEPEDNMVFLNCLGRVYGHSLARLLNAQYHIDSDHRSLIILVPSVLRWLVPEGVDVVVTVDWSLNQPFWSDELAENVREQVTAGERCDLSPAFPQPPANAFDIERFSRVNPFPLEEWERRGPTVTFITRPDRTWSSSTDSPHLRARLKGYTNKTAQKLGFDLRKREQQRYVVKFANSLRQQFSDLDFGVAGIDEPGGFPNWIRDIRVLEPDENDERQLCERYAASHVVIGIQGSNMLLPSAHAGAVVDLLPENMWGNLSEDIVLRHTNPRDALYHCPQLPSETTPQTLATVIGSILTNRKSRDWCRTDSTFAQSWQDAHAER